MIAPFTRLAALMQALRLMARRPLSTLLAGSAAVMFLTALLVLADLAWSARGAQAPVWMQAQALVLVGGGEGEVDLAALAQVLAQKDGVATLDFVSRDDALRGLTQRAALAAAGLAELRPNPLPDAFRVKFAPDLEPARVTATVDQLRHVHHVASVNFDADLYQRIHLFTRLARATAAGVLLIFVLGLFLAGRVCLAGIFRLDAHAIALWHVLGADGAMIRRPHLYGAVLMAALLGGASWLLLHALTLAWASDLQLALRAAGLDLTLRPVPWWGGPAAFAAFLATVAMTSTVALRWRLRRLLR